MKIYKMRKKILMLMSYWKDDLNYENLTAKQSPIIT